MPFDGSQFETVASQMRALFKGGEKWGKGALYEQGKYCLLGGLIAVTKNLRGFGVENWGGDLDGLPQVRKLAMACATVNGDPDPDWCGAEDVPDLNDGSRTTFKKITRVLDEMERLEIAAQLKKLQVKTSPQRSLFKQKEMTDAV